MRGALDRWRALAGLAWTGVRRRTLGSVLTVLSVALGTGLAVTVSTAADSAEDSYSSLVDSSRSFDVLLGPPQGSALQNVLVTLFHVDRAEGTFPWSVYERYRKDERVAAAVPFAVGDTFRGHRVVGTSRAFFEVLHGADGKPLGEAVRGRLFAEGTALEVVMGSVAAARNGVRVGDEVQVTHGLERAVHEHAERWKVVGVMRPTGSPHDRAVFVPIDAFYGMQGHEAEHAADEAEGGHAGEEGDAHGTDGHETDAHETDGHESDGDESEETRGRRLSAVGLRLAASGLLKLRLVDEIRKGRTDVQASMPSDQVLEIKAVVGDLYDAFSAIAWLVIGVVLLGILVGLWNTIHGRRRELAILRALGARPRHVFAVIVLEALLLCAFGALFGLLLGRGGAHLAAPLLQEHGVRIDAGLRPFDAVVVLAVLGLGLLAGAVPAWRALRTPVAENLHPS